MRPLRPRPIDPNPHVAPVSCTASSADGRRIASGSYDGTIRIWDAARREVIAILEASGLVNGIAFSPDGRTIASGENYVHPVLGARLAQATLHAPDNTLTEREREITRLLALGHTNNEIASKLYLSVRTIETHRAHVMAKLKLHTRADLVQWALDGGLIRPGAH